MAKKDYYAILGIDKKSSPEEIKKAYREKAKEHHPDRNIGDALSVSKFQEIQEAFETNYERNVGRVKEIEAAAEKAGELTEAERNKNALSKLKSCKIS